MPQATDLIIKNGAAVDKTFTLLSGANDGQVAEWALKEGSSPIAFPRITYSASKATGARKSKLKIRVPVVYTDPATGVQKLVDVFEVNADVRVSDAVPESARNDCVAYGTNVFTNALIKAALRDGLSLT